MPFKSLIMRKSLTIRIRMLQVMSYEYVCLMYNFMVSFVYLKKKKSLNVFPLIKNTGNFSHRCLRINIANSPVMEE